MKQLATTLAVVAVMLVARRAHAVDHEGRISEVALSKNGDATVQFVEIVDLFGGEPYPNTPYKLAFFDAAGASIGDMQLSLTGSHAKYYVSTAAADAQYGTTGDDRLAISLPANGQVCFQRSNGASNISCFTWGCITHFVQPIVERGATPPDNMSISRQPTGTFQITTPTPNNTTNATGTAAVPCPSDPLDMPPPPDAGIPHDAPTNPNNPDAGTGGGGKGGGCCDVDGRTGALGASVLAAIVLLVTSSTSRRRRRS